MKLASNGGKTYWAMVVLAPATLPVKQTRLISAFQLLYMLCYGRLTDKQLLRSFRETQVLRYRLKYF